MTDNIVKRVTTRDDPVIKADAGLTAKYFCICQECDGNGMVQDELPVGYDDWGNIETTTDNMQCDHCTGNGIISTNYLGAEDFVVLVIVAQKQVHYWFIPPTAFAPGRRHDLEILRARLPDEYHDPNLDLSLIDAELTRLAIDDEGEGEDDDDIPF